MQRNSTSQTLFSKNINPLELVLSDNTDEIYQCFNPDNAHLLLKKYDGTEPNGRYWHAISPAQFAAWAYQTDLIKFFNEIFNEGDKCVFQKQIKELEGDDSEHGSPLSPLNECASLYHNLSNEIIAYINTQKLKFNTIKNISSKHETFTDYFQISLQEELLERIKPTIQLAYNLTIYLPLNQFKLIYSHPHEITRVIGQQAIYLATQVSIFSSEPQVLEPYIRLFNSYQTLLTNLSKNKTHNLNLVQ